MRGDEITTKPNGFIGQTGNHYIMLYTFQENKNFHK